ncbi:MAG: GGDEF domain-containing protein [Desulfomicrobium sp.]|jgi:diguanylate cyclase (GGDEF)-like protein|nr:GGDEF domain-containing protein [Desulfomicrobium sp.]NLV97381.1 GGDEF domain-containing protein [Desulfovibrionales bacterium]
MDTPQKLCLGLDCTPDLAAQLRSLLPAFHSLTNLSSAMLSHYLEKLHGHESGYIFISESSWEKLSPEERQQLTCHEPWQYILIADQHGPQVTEFMASGVFLTVVTFPLNKAKIARALAQAEEISDMYQDIFLMAREISLERELLTRKNEQLAFFNRLLTRATSTLDPATIIANCTQDLSILLEVRAVLGVFWTSHEHQVEAEVFIPNSLGNEHQEQWINHLLSVAQRYTHERMYGYQVTLVPSETTPLLQPELEQLVTQPLLIGEEVIGALVICSKEAQTLGQDRVQVLAAAANHLALALRNGLEFRKTKVRADHDGLTRISNRQNFDARLREEIKRHQRHHQELSMMMIDLDYFKAVNDTYGHQAGDMVLQEVGQILQKTLRESDFPARYGGEEFIILLPQTEEEQAWMLAERLRTVIGQTIFRFHGKRFRVTASIGIAGIKPGALTPPEEFIRNADVALYHAKTNGRNMVCCSAIEEMVAP